MYNGDIIWEKCDEDNPDITVQYLLDDDAKNLLNEYASEKVAFGTPNYPAIPGNTIEAAEARRLRDFKAAVYSVQNVLDDTLDQYPDIKKYSDEYYGLWLYYTDLRVDYEAAGQLIKDMEYQITQILLMIIPVARELVSNIKQYANIRHTVKLVGGKQVFLQYKNLILEYGDDAIEALQKYDSIKNSVQLENGIVESVVDKIGVSSKIEQTAELANKELYKIDYTKPPYKPGTKTQIVTFSDDIVLVRVTNGSNSPVGKWWMRESDMCGLSPYEIKNKFALPDIPTNYYKIRIPSGSTFRVGISNSLYGCEGGGLQFEAYQNLDFDLSWIIEEGRLQ